MSLVAVAAAEIDTLILLILWFLELLALPHHLYEEMALKDRMTQGI